MICNDTFNLKAVNELRKYIEFLRKELITVGQQYGLNSKEAIETSVELDHYLVLCQRCCPKENRK